MRFWFVGILAIFLFASVSATIDVNVAQVRSATATDTNYGFNGSQITTPNFGATRDVNIIIDFNILSPAADGNSVIVDINYSTRRAEGTDGNSAHVITNDLNLSAISARNGSTKMDSNSVWCDTLTWSTRTACHYYWNISGIPDGNYYINISIDNNVNGADFNSSGITIRIDNTVPVYGTDFNRFMRRGANNAYLDANGYTAKNINLTAVNDFNGAITSPSRDAFIATDSNVRIALRIGTGNTKDANGNNIDANFTPLTDVNIIIKDFNYRGDVNGMTCAQRGSSLLNNKCNIAGAGVTVGRNWNDYNFSMTAAGLDINSSTSSTDGNYYVYYFDFNMGNFDTNFTTVRPRFIIKDAVGNVTDTNSTADMNSRYNLFLFSATFPNGADATDVNTPTTNLQDINNFNDIKRFQFSKHLYGSVTFNSIAGINFTNAATANKLRTLGTYLTMASDSLGTGNVRITFDSLNFSDLNSTDTNADLNFFNLPLYNAIPGIRMIQNNGTDVNCGSVCPLYSFEANGGTGDMNVRVRHFTSFEPDANFPTTSEPSPSGSLSQSGSTTVIGIKTNEQATCRYSSTDGSYDSMSGNPASAQSVVHQWAASTPATGAYTFYVRCKDATDHNMSSSSTITFTLTSGGGGGTPPAGDGGTPPAGGGGTPPAPQPVITMANGQVTATLPAVTAAAPLTLDLSAYSTPISQIMLIASGNMSSGRTVQVKETTLSQETASPVSTNGRIFKIMEIKMSSTINLREAKLQVKIPKAWFTENQVNKDSISLVRLVGQTWIALGTTNTSSDAGNEYFEATTPGFSLFAITGEKTVVSPPGPPTPEPTEPTPPTQPPSAPPAAPPAQPQPFNWTLPIIVLIIVVIAAGYYLTTQRRKKGL